jgi:hypothetical protein
MANEYSEIETMLVITVITVLAYLAYKSIKNLGPFDWEKRMAPYHYKIRLYGFMVMFWIFVVALFYKLIMLIINYYNA